MCGDPGHLARECPKRAGSAVSVAAAAPAASAFDMTEFSAFQEWRAINQAAAAVTVEAEHDEDDDWDDEEYTSCAVAIPQWPGGSGVPASRVPDGEHRGLAVVGSDWVDNATPVVEVHAKHVEVAPSRVLLDGGSFYTLVGARLGARLGLTVADQEPGVKGVATATGRVENLGFTKRHRSRLS